MVSEWVEFDCSLVQWVSEWMKLWFMRNFYLFTFIYSDTCGLPIHNLRALIFNIVIFTFKLLTCWLLELYLTRSAAGVTACATCPVGQFGGGQLTYFFYWVSGFLSNSGCQTINCPAGQSTYAMAGLSPVTGCITCNYGYYAKGNAQSCTAYSPGYTSTQTNGGNGKILTIRLKFVENYKCIVMHRADWGAQVVCPSGQFQSYTGAHWLNGCISCPAGAILLYLKSFTTLIKYYYLLLQVNSSPRLVLLFALPVQLANIKTARVKLDALHAHLVLRLRVK